MLFNSLEFLVFFPIVVWIYFCISHRWRWLWLLVASYYFYMSWVPYYGILLVATTLIDYVIALRLRGAEAQGSRRLLLGISIAGNLGLLFFFKYYDFVADSLNELFGWLHVTPRLAPLDLVLPIGISFYVLQSLGYVIDVYRRRIAPEEHAGIFMLYVSFFPQLVAGPIERAGNLLPQFHREHWFDERRVADGLKLMAWGFFKKVVIADNLSFYVDSVFAAPDNYYGWAVLIASYFFAFQVYCDFSGYSDIAIGCARILGIDLMDNFRRPFLSRSFQEFWQRWHISLTSWFRDYVYFPLGGSRDVSARRANLNILVVFVISGIWHGAQWTFVVWGLLCGWILVVAKRVHWGGRAAQVRFLPLIYWLGGIFVTFNLFALTLIFFRANSITDAFLLLTRIPDIMHPAVSRLGGDWLQISANNLYVPTAMFVGLAILMGVEVLQECGISFREEIGKFPAVIRWGVYYSFVMMIILFGAFSTQAPFIYFQF